MKNGFLKVLMLVLSIFLVGCGGEKEKIDGAQQAKAPQKKVIKMSMKFVEDEQTAKTFHQVANKINDRLKDNLEIQVLTGEAKRDSKSVYNPTYILDSVADI